ncbi:biotin carboxylase [Catenulispora sp. EB89]|uniref:ATP-grasp domain-containing protein n=1 Tax=Catenulispora sp. EB89 TaxID=3156257 RepID=UPI003512C3CA
MTTSSATPSPARVLIGFADAFAAIESAWSLADAGYEVFAFARRGSSPALAASRRVRIVPVTAPEDDAAACVADVVDAAQRLGASVLMPLDDLAVWVADRTGLRVAGATGRAAEFALDKRLQVEAAAGAGFAVPARTPGGPWIVKAAMAAIEQDGKLIRPGGRAAATEADVEAATADLAGPVLVQQLLTGVGEGVFGFATPGGVRAWSGHRRVRMTDPRGSASSACRSIAVDDELRQCTEKLLASVGWRGMFMVELLRDADGTPWFMEVNGRPWGSMALAVRRGFDYPVWAVRQALDPAFVPEAPEPEPPHIVCRHLGRELIHLAAVLRGPMKDHPGPWPKRGATLAALRPTRADRWYNLRAGERRVFWRDTWSTLATQAARMRRRDS